MVKKIINEEIGLTVDPDTGEVLGGSPKIKNKYGHWETNKHGQYIKPNEYEWVIGDVSPIDIYNTIKKGIPLSSEGTVSIENHDYILQVLNKIYKNLPKEELNHVIGLIVTEKNDDVTIKVQTDIWGNPKYLLVWVCKNGVCNKLSGEYYLENHPDDVTKEGTSLNSGVNNLPVNEGADFNYDKNEDGSEPKFNLVPIKGRANDYDEDTHFAVHKETNGIVRGWEYDKTTSAAQISNYCKQDLKDEIDYLMKKFKLSDFVIVTRKGLKERGIDLNNFKVFKGENFN